MLCCSSCDKSAVIFDHNDKPYQIICLYENSKIKNYEFIKKYLDTHPVYQTSPYIIVYENRKPTYKIINTVIF